MRSGQCVAARQRIPVPLTAAQHPRPAASHAHVDVYPHPPTNHGVWPETPYECERETRVDDRRFDALTRRVADLPLPLSLPMLPRRLALRALGGAALAGSLGPDWVLKEASARKKDRNKDKDKDKNAKCKKEGKKCDKKKCKKKGKKCCCDDLKCKNDRCKGKGGGNGCPIWASNNGSWGGEGTGDGKFDNPFGIATDDQGNVYVTDTDNFRVQVFRANGTFSDEWGEFGSDNDQFREPLSIGVGEDGGGARRVYVTDPEQSGSRKFRKFRTNGTHEGNLGTGLSDPYGVAVDPDQNVWVLDRTGEIFLYDDDGDPVTSWPISDFGLFIPEGIAVFEEKNRTFVYVTDTGNDRVVKFEYLDNSSDGLEFLDEAGSTGSRPDEFLEPAGIAVDECGNLWVADRDNNRIQILDKNLNFISRFEAGFSRPTGVALSPNGKSLYVVDSGDDRVRRFRLRTSRNDNRARASGLIQE